MAGKFTLHVRAPATVPQVQAGAIRQAPANDEDYWRKSFRMEPFYVAGKSYEYYALGFRAGWDGRVRHDGRIFAAAEADLAAAYNSSKSAIDPDWHEVRPAASAAWDRVERRRATAYSIEQAITQHGR